MALENLLNAITDDVYHQYQILDRILKNKHEKHKSYMNLEKPYASAYKVHKPHAKSVLR